MTARLTSLVIGRPRLVIATWAALTAIAAAVGVGLLSDLSNRGLLVEGSDSHRTAHALLDHVPESEGTGLFAVVDVRAPAAADRRLIALRDRVEERVTRRLERVRDVVAVSPIASDADRRDGNLTAAIGVLTVRLGVSPAAAEQRLGDLRAAIEPLARSNVSLALVGGPPASARYSEVAREDLSRAERIALPVTLAVLLVAFLSVTAAVLPLVLAVVTMAVTFSVLYVLNLSSGLSVFVTNTASVLALGLSIDFSLFMVMRFREEMRGSGAVEPALAATLATAGRTVALSGATIAASVASLFAVGVGVFSSMAVGGIVATLVAVLAATTLLPAILRVLGRRIDLLAVARGGRVTPRTELWRRLARMVTAHPVLATVASAAVLVVLALPARGLQLDLHVFDALPQDDPQVGEAQRLARAFGPGAIAPLDVVARTDRLTLRNQVTDDPGVDDIWTTTKGTDGWWALRVVLRSSPDSDAARATIRRLRARSGGRAGPPHVGGATATAMDLTDRVADRAPLVVLIATVTAGLALGAGLRSIVVPIKAMLGSLLSVGAALGVLLVLLPSDPSDPGVEFFVPLFMFAIVFGLSIDYELFLLSRIRESFLSGRSIADSISDGLVHSGRTITLTGIALATVFTAFATSSLDGFRQLGLGIAIAVFLDVTLVRCVLVPASMVLLGRWNWWLPRRRAADRS